MSVLLTPGVYRRHRREPRPNLQLVRTDVAGFAGVAERGPLPGLINTDNPFDAVVRLTSWAEYTAIFGGFIPHGYLAYAVRAFFENGGQACHVIRVAATRNPADPPLRAGLPIPSRKGERVDFVIDPTKSSEPGIQTLNVKGSPRLGPGDVVRAQSTDKRFGEFAVVQRMTRTGEGMTIELSRPLLWEIPQEDIKSSAITAQGTLSIYNSSFAFKAISAGAWGNRLWLNITRLAQGEATKEFSLSVFLEGPEPQRKPLAEEFYHRLSLDPESPWFINRHLDRSNLIRLEGNLPSALPESVWEDLQDWAKTHQGWIRLSGGRDGAPPSAEDFTGQADDLRGLRLLEEVDEIAILAVPDAVFSPLPGARDKFLPPPDCGSQSVSCCTEKEAPPKPGPVSVSEEMTTAIYHAMLDQCERCRDRVAIFDVPVQFLGEHVPLGAAIDWREKFQTRFGAMYHPWLRVPEIADDPRATRLVPPSGHVAGLYAQNDLTRGVQHPPGNLPLRFITSVAEEITDGQQEQLNSNHLNAIRPFAGRGIRIWGVRSLSSPDDGAWRYIHVRRLVSMIEESIDKGMQWTAFEPNDDRLRRALTHSITVFLTAIWQRGGLKGARPEEGFYVRCDETNNPPVVVSAGQIICRIGLAITDPMEFIEVEIRHAADTADQLAL